MTAPAAAPAPAPIAPNPIPFDSDETDAILAWFAQNDPYCVRGYSFCFGLVYLTAKPPRCDGMTST